MYNHSLLAPSGADQSEPRAILDHFRLDLWDSGERPHCFLLLCRKAAITVRSQQVRAMNLIWALHRERLLDSHTRIGVIGAGAAGLTVGAAAATLGASVDIYEASNPMHLQIGCWHRPLHPEISLWPEDTAYRPVSHLPLLGWSSGTADAVAREILNKFNNVYRRNRERLRLFTRSQATIARDGMIWVNGAATGAGVDIIVIAVGFGVETTPAELPMNSYWRVDSLDQSLLGDLDTKTTVVVSGSGDGGITDALRACIEESEQGAFLDQILALTMNTGLRAELRRIFALKDPAEMWNELVGLDAKRFPAIRDVDDALLDRRRGIQVKWFFEGQNPFARRLPLAMNRFLAARLAANAKTLGLQLIGNIGVTPEITGPKNGTYHVSYPLTDEKPVEIECRQAVFRWGSEQIDGLSRTVATVFDPSWDDARRRTREHLKDAEARHDICSGLAWDGDEQFLKLLETPVPRAPLLLASFVAGFESPDPSGNQKAGPFVFRIRVWMAADDGNSRGIENRRGAHVPPPMPARYDLHPSEGNRPVTRVGFGPDREIWINTRNDYEIRVRMGDGYEWSGGTVLEALAAWYFGAANQSRTDPLPALEAPIEMSKRNGRQFDPINPFSVSQALHQLVRQSASLRSAVTASSA